MNKLLLKTYKQNKAFLLFILLMMVFRSSFADWNEVPTGSMKPTIIEGDRILINKLAYDVQMPFSSISLFKLANPARGDIIIFKSAAADKRLVKRVIGLPGDIIDLTNNTLSINGQPLKYKTLASQVDSVDLSENLFGQEHTIRINKNYRWSNNIQAARVPAEHYLVLGDNRDNSADSRVIGFVPRHEIIGRTKKVVLSLNYENYYIPRNDRFMRPL